MKQLRVTDEAKADLIDIWSYISQNNEDAADVLIDKITGKFDELLAIPLMGRERIDTALTAAMRYIPKSESFDKREQGEKLYCIIAGSAVLRLLSAVSR